MLVGDMVLGGGNGWEGGLVCWWFEGEVIDEERGVGWVGGWKGWVGPWGDPRLGLSPGRRWVSSRVYSPGPGE